MRLTTIAMCPAYRGMARLWQCRPLVANASVTAELGIRFEAALRLLARDEAPARPCVSWHEGGAGPALVLLNGFSGSGIAWPASWVARLERTHRVIRIDNRGTGWSRDAPIPFTIGDMAEDVRDVLDALQIPRATIFGLSMGGMIAQEFAVRHPHRASKIVLAGTIPPIPHAVASPYGLSRAGSLLAAHGRDREDPSLAEASAAASLWLRFAARDFTASPDLVAEMGHQALSRATPWRSVMMQSRAIYSWRGARRLASITTPTVIVHGAADRVILPENAHRLARFIPGSQLVELQGIGHLVPWEAGDELAMLLGA